MPLFRRRRYARRSKLSKKTRMVKRRRMAKRSGFGNQGTIRIIRKTTENNIYNTAVAGTPGASGSVVVLGTPYNNPFAGSNYYNIPFSIETSLSDVLNYTELTQIADKYKINWVKVKVFATSNIASAASTAQLPSILWSMDEDDSGVPVGSTAGLNAIREKMGSKYRQFKQNGSGITMFYKPRLAREVYNAGGAAVGAEVTPAKFLDCTYPDIPHYGIKGFLQDVNLAATPTAYTQIKFDVTMSVTLKDIQ